MNRIRHCVECPNCRLRYVLASSPYRNGSHLVHAVDGSDDRYLLYCSCANPLYLSGWNTGTLSRYVISRAAYLIGYGTSEEIMQLPQRTPFRSAPRKQSTA